MTDENADSISVDPLNRRWVTADTPPTKNMKEFFFVPATPPGGHRKDNRKKIVRKKKGR
jgi:hypothetical protein